MLSLTAEKRDSSSKLEALREAGKMPAVFYGPKEDSTSIALNAKEFSKVWKKAGESSVVILKDASGIEHETLIHEVDIHPLSGEPRHADFYVIEKGKKVKVAVQLVFSGVSPAVKDKAGILVKVHREIEIEAAPRDLPHDLIVDISKLVEFADVIKAKDLILPKGVELKEEIEEAPAAIDMTAIEVETKGKEIKEGEAGAEAPAVKEGGDQKATDKKSSDKKPEKK